MGNKKTHDEFVRELYGVNSNIEVIGQYLDSQKKIKCRCVKCGHIWSSVANQLLRGSICPECNRLNKRISNEEFTRRFNKIGNNIELLGEYVDVNTKIPCRCKIHNYKWAMTPPNLLRGRKCPLCTKNKVVHGYNDLLTVRPDLEIYIIDKNEVYELGVGSKKKIKVKCPLCGYIRTIAIYQLTSIGFSCPKCSDGISYPNKFSRALLEQLPVENVQYEYSPDWAENYRYDNYFEYQDKFYILEMDGKFHYIDNNMNGVTKEQQQNIDNYKNMLAQQHGVTIIRIDSRKSDVNYLKQNILLSRLNYMFNLKKIDWNYCDKMAMHNILYDVCYYYKEHPDKSTSYIGSVFGLSRKTVTNYLKRGNNAHLCNYTKELAENRRIQFSSKKRSKRIIALDSNRQLIKEFDSIKNCSKYLQDIYGEYYDSSSITKVCKGKYKTYKGLYFQYVS